MRFGECTQDKGDWKNFGVSAAQSATLLSMSQTEEAKDGEVTFKEGSDILARGRRSVPEVTVGVDGVVLVLEPSRRRRYVLRPLPSDAGSSPKDTQLSEQICASKQTRVGAELPRPQTQSRLKANLSDHIRSDMLPRESTHIHEHNN
jgi:hypothetical protein